MAGDVAATAPRESEKAGDEALDAADADGGVIAEAGAGAPKENFNGTAAADGFAAAVAKGSALGAFDAVGGYEGPAAGFAAAVAKGSALGAFDAVGGYEAGLAAGAGAGGPKENVTGGELAAVLAAGGFAPKLKPDAPMPVVGVGAAEPNAGAAAGAEAPNENVAGAELAAGAAAAAPNENVAGAGLAAGAGAPKPKPAPAPPPNVKPVVVMPPAAAAGTFAGDAAFDEAADGFGLGVSQALHFVEAAVFLIEHVGHFHSPACSLPRSPNPDAVAAALGVALSHSSSSSSSLSANTQFTYHDTNASLCTRPSAALSLSIGA